MAGDEELSKIKSKLVAFEQKLQELIESSKDDLAIAEQLQKVLMPNRVPQIPGVQCIARYMPAFQISSESFDIIPTKEGRQLWLVMSMTGSFGLSSLLLQTLVHLQTKALVEARPKIAVTELFNDLSISLSSAKKAAPYRLFVGRLDLASLELSGVGIGVLPPLVRRKDKSHYAPWEWAQAAAVEQSPALLQAPMSSAPVLAERAYTFSLHLEPGLRIFFMSAEWQAAATRLERYTSGLALTESAPTSDLLKDLNHLLVKAQDSLLAEKRACDVSALALEIDAKKLHLA